MGGAAGTEALEGGGAGLGVHRPVVDGLGPGGKKLVQPLDIFDAGAGGLDQELVPHGAEDAFYLAPAFGPAGAGMHEPDAQTGAGPQ